MTDKLIARERECQLLKQSLESDESEFVIICGRRRIGKTFLVEQFFERKYDFKFVGGHNMKTRDQLKSFAKALKKYSGKKKEPLKTWFDAFDALEEYLESLPDDRKKVIFIDEMPWMDSSRADFISALENFWNGWANGQSNILLVATGSATSWMTDKLLKNRGGLYNRIRQRIYLKPFTLKETEQYLKSLRFDWDRYQILQSYMLTGGVPFYLKMLNPKLSFAQNIDNLCFSENGILKIEFDELYNSIFNRADTYIEIVRTLSKNKSGLTRQEISEKINLSGAFLTKVLTNLERCNFIDKTNVFGIRKSETIYRLVDFYTLFYFKFIENNNYKDEQWWTHNIDSRSIYAWMGLTFELVCILHQQQIKKALGISGMSTSVTTWRFKPKSESDGEGVQIDMIIERADRIIHLCEMKFSEGSFNIPSEYESKLRNRRDIFREKTKTKKSIVHTFVTTYGVGEGKHHSIVHSEVTMNDLFES